MYVKNTSARNGGCIHMVGRRFETQELTRFARTDKSELICIYGRRRVGKTYLVEQTFVDCFAFRATGVEGGNTRHQLRSFHQRLIEHGDPCRTIPKNWFEAFSRLESVLSSENALISPHGKKIVFFDEFPWFVTARSDFLMAFGEFWNRCGTAAGNYLFIICGSATSWIIKNVLENTGSLYNRVTGQIFLEPFTLAEAEHFFYEKSFGWSRRQIAECSMVFGGLPYFMELLDGNDSLARNIDRLCFAEHAFLRNESVRLLEATLKKTSVYEKILSLLSGHRYGLPKSECLKLLSLPKGSFMRAVEDLVKCGYINEYKNYRNGGNPLILQLMDPFLLFHYRFLSGDPRGATETFSAYVHDTGSYADWRGHAFEILCLHHLAQIRKSLGISGVRTVCFPWVSKRKKGGAQIDLVIERDDGITNICEMKYTDRPFPINADYEKKLLHKKNVYREETGTQAALKIVMISAEGVQGSAHTEHIAQILTLDDLYC